MPYEPGQAITVKQLQHVLTAALVCFTGVVLLVWLRC